MFYYFLILFLFSSVAQATEPIEYEVSGSFRNQNYLLHRDDFQTNDRELLKLSLSFSYDDQKHFKLFLEPKAEIDFLDHDHDRFIPDEAYFRYYTPHMEFSAGLELLGLGVSESYNPTDFLNRYDFEQNLYDPDKRGELVVSWKGVIDKAGPFSELTFKLMAFPLFQETPLPENDTRFGVQGTARGISYSLNQNQDTLDYPEAMGGALQISATVNTLDFNLIYYHGPDHTPGMVLVFNPDGTLSLTPFYYLIDRVGLNAEIPVGKFLFSLESAFTSTAVNDPRKHQVPIPLEEDNALPESYFQFVPGVEYTFDNVGTGNLVVSAEYLGEWSRDNEIRNMRPFKNDIFIGARYDFANNRESKIEVGFVKDLQVREAVIKADVSTKIYKDLRLDVGGIAVFRSDDDRLLPFSAFPNNSYIYTTLSYSFGGKM